MSSALAHQNHPEGLLEYRLWAPPLELLIQMWSRVPETAFLANSQEMLLLLVPLPGIASVYPHVAVKFQPTCHLLHKVFLHPSKYFPFFKKKNEVIYLIPYRIKLKFCPFALLSFLFN